MNKKRVLICLAAAVALITVPVSLSASGAVDLPGALPGARSAGRDGFVVSLSRETVIDGRHLKVTSVLADAEQTVIGYQWTGAPEDGPFVTIAPRPRLVLEDGTIIPSVGNGQSEEDRSRGSLTFAAVPGGTTKARLEIDGAVFTNNTFQRRFEVTLAIDTGPGYAASIVRTVDIHAGSGPSAVIITRVSKTPSLVVVRGEFKGLTVDQIQQVGRPNVVLVDAQGDRVESESGRMGFGDGYRSFEFRFPAPASSGLTILFSGFTRAENLGPGLSRFDSPVELALPLD
jgi:hypothetical protein